VRAGVHDVKPASLSQVMEGQDGRMIVLDDDVGNVVKDLQRIDPTFRVRYMERGDCFVVFQDIREGDRRTEHFVFSVDRGSFDQRVVKECERITHESYDLDGELAQGQARQEAERRQILDESIERTAEHMVWGLRRENGVKDRVFVP
jgi:hypothetical protein